MSRFGIYDLAAIIKERASADSLSDAYRVIEQGGFRIGVFRDRHSPHVATLNFHGVTLKHAFPDGREGTVTIRLRAEGPVYVLAVSDDGVGLPEDVDPSTTESLGLQLVDTLTRQLGGSLRIRRGNGTQFEIAFADNLHAQKG